MRCIEPWHFRWPWVTSEGHFSTVLTLCAQLRRDLLAIAKCLVFCEPIMRETYENTYFLVLRDKLIQFTERSIHVTRKSTWRNGSKRCFRQVVKSNFSIMWPWALTSWSQKLIFHFRREPRVPFRSKFGSFVFKMSRSQVWQRVNERADRSTTLCLLPV